MSHVTLIMTRKPTVEFNRGRQSGRWGRMVVVCGAPVRSAKLIPADAGGSDGSAIPFADGGLELMTDGGAVEKVADFDTMERFKADTGKGYYMQVRPRPDKPYDLKMFRSSTVARLNHTGKCLRVLGHGYTQQGTGQAAGILVHEAPNVGWLIGCISPRLTGNRRQGEDRRPSTTAMDTIFEAMGGFADGKMASLLVLDW